MGLRAQLALTMRGVAIVYVLVRFLVTQMGSWELLGIVALLSASLIIDLWPSKKGDYRGSNRSPD